MARPKPSFAQCLGMLALLGLVVRVWYVLAYRDHIPLGGDSLFYSLGADLLVAGEGFVEPVTTITSAPVEQSASHPPLYLLYLAVASFLDPTPGSSQLVHMLWSCVLGTATVVVCGLAGREVAGRRCGVVAAALAALYPNMWVHDGMLLSETMSLFMTALVILLAYRFWHRPSGARAAWLGLCCGLAALSRPELILTVPLLLVPLVLLTRTAAWSRRAWWVALGGGAAVLAIGPWVVFNLTRFEEPVYLTHSFGYTLAAANCDATYYGDEIGFKNYQCASAVSQAVTRPGMDPSSRENVVRKEVLDYVNENLDRVPVVVAARIGRITGLFRPRQEVTWQVFYPRRERWAAEAELYSYYMVAASAVAGGVVLRRRRVTLLPLVTPPLIVLAAVAITFAQTRYRAPAEAALVVLAAVAIDALLRLRNRRRVAAALAPRAEEAAELEPLTPSARG